MSSRAIIVALAVIALVAGSARADVSVQARLNPAQVTVGASAELSLEVRGTQNAQAPTLAAPEGVSIRYVGPSTQVSIVNGQISASVTLRYVVTPQKEGTFTIGPIQVEAEGAAHDAGSVTLQVVAQNAAANQPQAAAAGRGKQLSLVLSVPKTEVYLHERIPLTLQLYIAGARVSDLQYPTVPGEGFSIDKFPEPQQRQERTAQGVVDVVDFRTSLVPLRSGTMTIGPAAMGLNVVSRGRGGDPFFEGFFNRREPTELRSDPLTLTVLPLPDEGKPAEFSGAVGQFDFDLKAGPLDLQAGDPVTVTMTIRGAGNFEHVTAPGFTASDSWRVYPAQAQPVTNPQERVFEQVVIPEQPGAVTLPEMRFSYFDPAARAYRTIARPPIALTVRAAAQQAAPQIVGAAPQAVAVPETLGRDIVFIKDTPGDLAPIGSGFGLAFWLFQPLPLLAWLGVSYYTRQRDRLSGDVRYARFTRAGRQARQAIAQARATLGGSDRAACYDAVARAISDYLSAKLDLPPGSVTAESVAERLQGPGVSAGAAQTVAEVREFFAACERARFTAAAVGDADLQAALKRADTIVNAVERERRLGVRLGSVVLLVGLSALLLANGMSHAAAPLASENPNTIFFRANSLYTEERYTEAAAQYEQVLASGVASGHLYFNLGNAYFKLGDVGHAVLNYERALRALPRDPDLHANLGFARTLSGDTDEPPVYARLFFPLATRMTGGELWGIASLLYTMVMLVLIVGQLVPALQPLSRRAALVAAVLLAIVLPSAIYRARTTDRDDVAVVTTSAETTVRFEPSANGTAHYTAKPGSVLHVLSEREGWTQVARRDGQRGWIGSASISKL